MPLAHPGLKDPEYYVPGLSRDWVVQRYGIAPDQVAKLGSAENPLGPSPRAVTAVREAASRLDLYPPWTADPLREELARTYGGTPEQYVVGAGETELISCLIRAFAEPGGKVQMPRPCFPIYHLFAEAEGRRAVMVDTVDMALDVDAYAAAIEPDTRLVFVTAPHSPSGTGLEEAQVRRIVEAAPHALVVLDEAYVHYSGTEGHLALAHEYPHLIVLRTFSKAFGLAGLRVGFGVADRAVIDPLLAVKPTWNMGQLQLAGAIAALDDAEHVDRTVTLVAEQRDRVATRMTGLDRFRLVPGSRANFFLVEILDPAIDSTSAFNGLLERGVVVKDGSVSFRGLGDRYLRVDVNLPAHMDRFVDALADLS
jgi:histidinol-phosphate aminotransferase